MSSLGYLLASVSQAYYNNERGWPAQETYTAPSFWSVVHGYCFCGVETGEETGGGRIFCFRLEFETWLVVTLSLGGLWESYRCRRASAASRQGAASIFCLRPQQLSGAARDLEWKA